jgi:hypothetical protein
MAITLATIRAHTGTRTRTRMTTRADARMHGVKPHAGIRFKPMEA